MLIPILPRYVLMSVLPEACVGLELGVFRGEFSNMLLRNVKPSLLHLVDTWKMPAGAGAESGDMVHASVLRRFAPEIRQKRVQVHRATAAEVLGAQADESLDFVYISGDKSYAGMMHTLRLAARKIKPGGLVCGTDYTTIMPGRDGVVRAVHDFLVEGNSTFVVALLIGVEFGLRRLDPKTLEQRAERKSRRKAKRKQARE